MDTQNTNFLKILKRMKSSNYVYLAVLVLFFVIIFILFLYSTSFILLNINKIFLPAGSDSVQALNMTNYSLIEKKLNLTTSNVLLDVNGINENTSTTPLSAATNIVVATDTQPTLLNKKLLKINILNSTTKKGTASVLAKSFTKAGFSIPDTGNEKKQYAITTMLIKESKKEYTPLVEEVVKNTYPKVVTNTNPENSDYDVIIIIGIK